MAFVQWSVACSVSCLAEKMSSKSQPCIEVATAPTFGSSFVGCGLASRRRVRPVVRNRVCVLQSTWICREDEHCIEFDCPHRVSLKYVCRLELPCRVEGCVELKASSTSVCEGLVEFGLCHLRALSISTCRDEGVVGRRVDRVAGCRLEGWSTSACRIEGCFEFGCIE